MLLDIPKASLRLSFPYCQWGFLSERFLPQSRPTFSLTFTFYHSTSCPSRFFFANSIHGTNRRKFFAKKGFTHYPNRLLLMWGVLLRTSFSNRKAWQGELFGIAELPSRIKWKKGKEFSGVGCWGTDWTKDGKGRENQNGRRITHCHQKSPTFAYSSRGLSLWKKSTGFRRRFVWSWTNLSELTLRNLGILCRR